jgi:hypothetical protein
MLEQITYFTARVRNDPEGQQRQSDYLDALASHSPRLTVADGRFQEKLRRCVDRAVPHPRRAARPLLADSYRTGGEVEWIAARRPTQPRWWMEFWNAAGHVDSPTGMVEEFVVAAAEGDTVSDAGGTFIGPMDAMVNIAPTGRYRTPGESAPAVSDDHSAANRGRHSVAGPPDIQGLTAGTQHNRNDPRITRDAAGDVGVDRTAERQRRRTDPTLEFGQADGDHDLGSFPTFGGQVTGLQRSLSKVDQGVGVALGGGAQVDLGVGGRAGCGQRAQSRADDLGGFPVEPSGQFTATVAVPEAEVPAGFEGVVGAAAVLIQISEDPFAQCL